VAAGPQIFIIVWDVGVAATAEAACCVSRFRPDVLLVLLGESLGDGDAHGRRFPC